MGVYIIAEAGVNHNGRLDLAKELVIQAAEAGCNAVKFQTYKTEKLVTKTASMATYQITNIGEETSQFDMLKQLELDEDSFYQLRNLCEECGIDFLSTPFDNDSVDFLYKLGVPQFKISSGDLTNKPLLKQIAQLGRPMIVSTGMAFLADIEDALRWIYQEGNYQVSLLHCTSDYPAEFDQINLKVMETLSLAFNCPVGYSDHTQGIEVPIAAVALGAKIIEKHFTLDKLMDGPDHKASLEPKELKEMVKAIRNVELALGTSVKRPTEKELETLKVARKSLVTNRFISKGMVIKAEFLSAMRPGTGMNPKDMDLIVGKIACRDLALHHLINWSDVDNERE